MRKRFSGGEWYHFLRALESTTTARSALADYAEEFYRALEQPLQRLGIRDSGNAEFVRGMLNEFYNYLRNLSAGEIIEAVRKWKGADAVQSFTKDQRRSFNDVRKYKVNYKKKILEKTRAAVKGIFGFTPSVGGDWIAKVNLSDAQVGEVIKPAKNKNAATVSVEKTTGLPPENVEAAETKTEQKQVIPSWEEYLRSMNILHPRFYNHYLSFLLAIGPIEFAKALGRRERGESIADEFWIELGGHLLSPQAVGSYFGVMGVQGFTDNFIREALRGFEQALGAKQIAILMVRQAFSMGFGVGLWGYLVQVGAEIFQNVDGSDGYTDAEWDIIRGAWRAAWHRMDKLHLGLFTLGFVLGYTITSAFPIAGQSGYIPAFAGYLVGELFGLIAVPIRKGHAALTLANTKARARSIIRASGMHVENYGHVETAQNIQNEYLISMVRDIHRKYERKRQVPDAKVQKALVELQDLTEFRVSAYLSTRVSSPLNVPLQGESTQIVSYAESDFHSQIRNRVADLREDNHKELDHLHGLLEEELQYYAKNFRGVSAMIEDSRSLFNQLTDSESLDVEVILGLMGVEEIGDKIHQWCPEASRGPVCGELYASVRENVAYQNMYSLMRERMETDTFPKVNQSLEIVEGTPGAVADLVRNYDLRFVRVAALEWKRIKARKLYEINPYEVTLKDLNWHVDRCERIVGNIERIRAKGDPFRKSQRCPIVRRDIAWSHSDIAACLEPPVERTRKNLEEDWQQCFEKYREYGVTTDRQRKIESKLELALRELNKDDRRVDYLREKKKETYPDELEKETLPEEPDVAPWPIPIAANVGHTLDAAGLVP